MWGGEEEEFKRGLGGRGVGVLKLEILLFFIQLHTGFSDGFLFKSYSFT